MVDFTEEQAREYMLRMGMTIPEETEEESLVPPLPPTRPPELMQQQEDALAVESADEPIVKPIELEEPQTDTDKSISRFLRTDDTERMLKDLEEKRKASAAFNASEGTKALAGDVEFMSDLRYHYEDLAGEEGVQADDETDIEYLNRYMSNRYRAYTGNEIESVLLLDHINNTDEKGRLAFGSVFSKIEEKAPQIGDQTFVEATRTVGDALYYGAYSPTTVVGTGLGFIAAGGGAALGYTAARQGIVSGIRKYLINKSVLSGSIGSGITSTVGDVALQASERLGHVDPATQQFDPSVDPKDIKLSNLRMGIAGAGGAFGGIFEGQSGRALAKNYRTRVNNQLARFANNADAAKAATEKAFVDSVANNLETGRNPSHILELAETLDAGLETSKSPKKLLDTLSDSFMFADNVSDKDLAAAYRAIRDPKIFQKMSEFSVAIQKDLNDRDMLDIMGQSVVDTFSGYKPKRKGITSITEVVADGFDAIDSILLGSQKGSRVGRAFDKNNLTDAESEIFLEALEKSMKETGVTEKEFFSFMNAYTDGLISINGRFAKGTVGDVTKGKAGAAGQTLVAMSNAARKLTTSVGPLLETDPVMKKIIETRYGRPDLVSNKMGIGIGALRLLENTRIASMTSQLITTARNVRTAGYIIGAKTGVEFVDSVIYHAAHGVTSAKQGNISVTGSFNGLRNILVDSLSTLDHVSSAWRSAKGRAVMEASLANNPRSMQMLMRYQADIQAEAGTKAGRAFKGYMEFLNQLNMSADSFFRRGFYLQSLDKRFKQLMREHKSTHGTEYMGGQFKNVLQYVEAGNTLPTKMIQGAVDDALKETLSYTPKHGVGRDFIRLMESTKPVSSMAITPFSRFMVNAFATMYSYTPQNALVKGVHNLHRKEMDSLAKNVLTSDEQRQAWGKSVVGGAAIYASNQVLASREEGTPWNEVEGMTQDAEYPLGGFLAMTYLFRMAGGLETYDALQVKRAFEVLSGIPLRQAQQSSSLLGAAVEFTLKSGDTPEDSVAKLSGRDSAAEFAGDILGSFFTPLRQFKDIGDAVEVEPTMRDVTTAYEDGDFGERVIQKMATGLPTEAFGFDLRDQTVLGYKLIENKSEAKNFLLNFDNTKYRNMPLARFIGINFSPKTSRLERAAKYLGFTDRDILPQTRKSARIYNQERYYFTQRAYEGLNDLLDKESYKSKDRNGKRKMFKEAVKRFRDQAREDAEYYMDSDTPKKARAAQDRFNNLPDDASYEDKANAMYDLVYYANYPIVNDYAKAQWLKDSDKDTVGLVEQEFEKRYLKAKKKYDNGEKLSGFEYLYLRGPTIAEQKTYKLASEYSKYLQQETEIEVDQALDK
jgi:hypothetical protein